MSDGSYLVDDTSFSWPQPTGSGATPQGGTQPSYSTGDLWLEITGLTDGLACLVLHGTTNGALYTILSRQSLSPTDPWDAEQPLTGAEGQDWTTVQVPIWGRPALFFEALLGSATPQRLWLYALGVTNNSFNFILHGTIPGTNYVLRSSPCLGGTNTWAFEGLCQGAAGQFWTSVSVPLSGRSNLFLSAQFGVSSAGDGIPDWWDLLYGFNPLDPSVATQDPDDDGLTNLQEYQSGGNPRQPMLVAWGDNLTQESTVPWGFPAVPAMAAGGGGAAGGHTVLLMPDGTVTAWGANTYGQTNVPLGLSNAVAVAAGGDQSAALQANGTVVQWGRTFAAVPNYLSGVTAIAVGYQHKLALRADGTVVSWGASNCPANTVPGGLSNVVAISAGWNHNLALRSDGTVVAWGLSGQALGWNLTNVPPGLTGVAAISAGALHSVALRNDGSVMAWGYNGGGETNVPANLPYTVAIAAGRGYTLALARDGTVSGWGAGLPAFPGAMGQLTNLVAGPAHALALRYGVLTPLIIGQPQSQAVLAGHDAAFTVSVCSRRQPAYQWQLNGTNIAGATTSQHVVSGVQNSDLGSYSVSVTNGAGWTSSIPAKLEIVLPPVMVSPLTPQVVWAPPGSNVVLSVTATAQASDLAPLSYYWYLHGVRIPWALPVSNLTLGMFGPYPEGPYSVTVTNLAGSTNSAPWIVHFMNPGTAVAWGDTGDGVANPPFGLSNVLAVACGQEHAVALLEGGAVVAWGNNDWGQTNVPADAANVTAVACGSDHTLALRADGTIIAWGDDSAARRMCRQT